jgi:hypothetical protein
MENLPMSSASRSRSISRIWTATTIARCWNARDVVSEANTLKDVVVNGVLTFP